MIPTAFGVLASSGGRVWSPTIKGPNISLNSAGNVATRALGGAWQSVLGLRSLAAVSTFTVVGTGTNSAPPGVGNINIDVNSFPGSNGNSICVNILGEVRLGGVIIGNTGFTYSSGDAITVELDGPGDQIRWSKNGGAPSAWFGLGAMTRPLYPAAGLFDTGATATL